MQDFVGTVRRCMEDYNMISDGDRVAVGVSGGKDSLALLSALAEVRRYYPKRFELTALTLSMGFEGMDFSPVADFCRSIDVPYIIKDTHISEVVFNEREEKNPCALCSKMRRGALNDTIKELGISKLALGHHMDDAIETFLMSLVYEGRITCFQPVTYMSRSEVTQIRPLVYCREQEVINYAARRALPIVRSTCPMDGVSKREDVKKLIASLGETFPDIKSKLFGAIRRYPLPGWETVDE